MAVSLKRSPARRLGYEDMEARRLARELGGVAVSARWKAAQGAWEIGGPGSPGLPHIVVLPLPGTRSRTTYIVLADNTAPVKTADQARAEFE
jgi:hypothetical protein